MKDVISLSTIETKSRMEYFLPQEGRVIPNAVEMSERIEIGRKAIRQSLVTFDKGTVCIRQ